VGDEYFDQIELNGHAKRADDLDLFASLYTPCATPYCGSAPHRHSLDADWSWADERLERMRELGIRPIIGFTTVAVHAIQVLLIPPSRWACSPRRLPSVIRGYLTRKDMDIAERASVDTALTALSPWAVVLPGTHGE